MLTSASPLKPPTASADVTASSTPLCDEIDDVELLNRHINGDDSAFATLVRRHYDILWRTALRASFSPEDASDALQDALLSAHRQAASYRGECPVRGWLYRIVVNSCRDRMRRSRHKRHQELTPLLAEKLAFRSMYYQDPVWSLVVAEALQEIPAGMRNAVVLVDMLGLSIADAAFLLNVPAGTVKSRCNRGRRHLAPLLAGVNLGS